MDHNELYRQDGRLVVFKIILAASILSLVLIPAANAQPRGGMMAAMEELQLTDQQMDKLADLRFEHQKAMISKRAELKEAELELKQLMSKATVDKKAAMASQDKISAAKAEIARMRLQHRLQMRDVLTKDQLQTWLKMQRMHGMHKGMRGEGRRRGPGMGMPEGAGPGMGMGSGGWMDPGTDLDN
jgi:Spy/CpxP family protein refolding chaperone